MAKIESGVHLFNRLVTRPRIDGFYREIFDDGPKPGEFIEINGHVSSGKTMLTTDIIARCILPLEHNGKGCVVYLVNTDGHFSLFALVKIMELMLKGVRKEQVKQLVVDALKRLLIVNVYNQMQMNVAIDNLANILRENAEIALVAIDSLSTFYWIERKLATSMFSMDTYAQRICKRLRHALMSSDVNVLFTIPDNFRVKTNVTVDWRIQLERNPLGNQFIASIVSDGRKLRLRKFTIGDVIDWDMN